MRMFCYLLLNAEHPDGIGRAMSFEFAKKGLSVLLISRTESKLVEVEAELQKKYPKVKIAHVAVDYSNFDEKAQVSVVFLIRLNHI
jgi:17beta-estradiol 17-dehydrogenase / very-long-chain 3-oxoacyl-CoA reductase